MRAAGFCSRAVFLFDGSLTESLLSIYTIPRQQGNVKCAFHLLRSSLPCLPRFRAAGHRQSGGDRDRQGIIYNEAAAAVRWAAPAYLSSVPVFRADGKICFPGRRENSSFPAAGSVLYCWQSCRLTVPMTATAGGGSHFANREVTPTMRPLIGIVPLYDTEKQSYGCCPAIWRRWNRAWLCR